MGKTRRVGAPAAAGESTTNQVSIQQQNGRARTWEELDLQTSYWQLELQDDVAAGGIDFEQFHTMEPMGGLSRDELAELVGMYIDTIALGFEGPADPSDNWFDVEISFDSTSAIIENDTTLTQDVDGETGVDRRAANVVDFDTIWAYSTGFSPSFEDGTDQTGGGATAMRHTDWVPMRQFVGAGPIVDRHDEIFWHIHRDGQVAAEGILVEKITWIWDVFEE